jgi:hypothetical protein
MSLARRRLTPSALVLALVPACLVLGACERVGDDPFAGLDGESSSSGDGPPTTGPVEPPPDLQPVYDCEPAKTDTCPMGQKCSAVSKGGLQNQYTCVPDDGALLLFEPCLTSPDDGQDSCASGTVCLQIDEQDPTSGRCLPGCRNDADCEPGLCTTSPFSGTTFCAGGCDPTIAVCPPDLSCRQARDRFICELSLDTDIGVEGEACEGTSLRGCAATYACMPGALVPDCASGFCCTTTCDINGPSSQCASPTLCTSLFSQPAPEFESVGACFVPA